jgi:hypothetical protein
MEPNQLLKFGGEVEGCSQALRVRYLRALLPSVLSEVIIWDSAYEGCFDDGSIPLKMYSLLDSVVAWRGRRDRDRRGNGRGLHAWQ